jgi:serine/threonine protein kinase
VLRVFGDYVLEELIGAGGMGTVYRAHRESSVRVPIALKIVHPQFAKDREIKARFKREAELGVELTHPNVVRVHHTGEVDGVPFLELELVDGFDVQKWLDEHDSPLPLPIALVVLSKVAIAVRHAHEHGVVHRDLKPSNILLSRIGEVKLGDFGLARSERTGTLVTLVGSIHGTPAYMSPEQLDGGRLSQEAAMRSDMFSLGVVAWELLAGRRLFSGDSYIEIERAVRGSEPEPIERIVRQIPPRLAGLVHGMLRKDPAQRKTTPAEFEEAMKSVVRSLRPFESPEEELAAYLADPAERRKELEQVRLLGQASTTRPPLPATPPPATLLAGSRWKLVLAGLVVAWLVWMVLPDSTTSPSRPALSVVAPRKQRASLRVTSDPPGAFVSIAGVSHDRTPQTIEDLDPGPTRISLRLSGYVTFADSITLPAGPRSYHRTLSRREPRPEDSKTGAVDVVPITRREIRVQTSPHQATVFVDGSTAPHVPIFAIRLGAGAHSMRAVNEELGIDRSFKVTVAAGASAPDLLILNVESGTHAWRTSAEIP